MKALITLLLIIFLGFHSAVFSQSTSEEGRYITLVDRLELEDSYEITIRSVGCFHNKQQTIIISREANSHVAILNDSAISLNPKKLEALRKFERQLRYIFPGGCTTIDTYILKYGPEEYIINDDSCTHSFGKILIEELGFTG